MDRDLVRFQQAAARENRGRRDVRRRYSPALRQQAVTYCLVRRRAGERVRDVAAALGVAPWSLHRWTKQSKPPRQTQAGALLFEFLMRTVRVHCELRDHGPAGSVKATFYKFVAGIVTGTVLLRDRTCRISKATQLRAPFGRAGMGAATMCHNTSWTRATTAVDGYAMTRYGNHCSEHIPRSTATHDRRRPRLVM
jgi:hypothetical protein